MHKVAKRIPGGGLCRLKGVEFILFEGLCMHKGGQFILWTGLGRHKAGDASRGRGLWSDWAQSRAT